MKKFLSTTKGKIIAGAVTLVVIAAAIVLIVLLNMGYRSIQVADLNGSTKITSGILVSEAFKGQNLQNGTSVSVSEKSDMTLALDTDKHVFAKELTKFKLEALGTAGKDSRTIIHLEEGSVLSEIDEKLLKSESYVVDAPNATMAVRGTTFTVTVSYDAAGLCHTSVEVEKGTVEVTEKDENGKLTDKTQTLNAGDKTEVISEVKRVENPAAGGTTSAPGSDNPIQPQEVVYQNAEAIAVENAIEAYLNGGALDTTNFERVTFLEIHGKVASVRLDNRFGGKGYLHSDEYTGHNIKRVRCSPDSSESVEIPTSKNTLTNLDFLTEMKKLAHLTIRYGDITDITLISQFSEMTYLNFDYNEISDISPLNNLTNLTRLSMVSNNISDISSLKNLTNLTYLHLGYNKISDISSIKNLTNLTDLSFKQYNGISDISPLKDMTKLERLDLWGNGISDITPLKGKTELTYLVLGANSISDITPLQDMTKLDHLALSYNNISDISPLKNLTNLTSLWLDSNKISDISLLKDMTNLTYLPLEKNQISDISPLKNMTNLTYVSLSENPISDFSPLYGLTNLNSVSLSDVTDDEIARLEQALPDTKIYNH